MLSISYYKGPYYTLANGPVRQQYMYVSCSGRAGAWGARGGVRRTAGGVPKCLLCFGNLLMSAIDGVRETGTSSCRACFLFTLFDMIRVPRRIYGVRVDGLTGCVY